MAELFTNVIKHRLRMLRHNLLAHPIAGLLWFIGLGSAGDWIHDNW